MRRLTQLLTSVVLALVAPAGAFASAIWWNSQAVATQFGIATAQLQSLALPSPVQAMAPVADGGAWVAHGNVLLRLRPDLVASAMIVLAPGAPDSRILLAATRDGGVWVAQGGTLRHLDGAGRPLVTFEHANRIDAMAVSGSRGVWVGDALGVHQYQTDGLLVRSVPLADAGGPVALLFDPAGGYLWVIAAGLAIQLDTLANLTERTRIVLPSATTAIALDPAAGVLWLLSGHGLASFNRDAEPAASWVVPAGIMTEASALAVDPYADRLWIGDLHGMTAFNLETSQWIRLTHGDAITSAPGAFFRMSPSITLVSAIAGPPAAIRLQLGALCNGFPCAAPLRYLHGLELHATVGGLNVVDQITVDRDAAFAHVRDVESLSIENVPLRISVSDSYGNHSAELDLDLPVLLGAALPTHQKANALPVVTVSAPANNAVFVAPINLTVSAIASDSDGTITKVEFYRDGVLLGTDTASPYSYAWNNVPVGTYKLTAKAYDNAGGTKISAIVTIVVKTNVAPTVALTSPINNSTHTAPATINLAASASDRDGSITKVEFFQGATKLATDTAVPYAFTWSNVAGGTYRLMAKATDDKGAVTTSAIVSVKVNKEPTVALSAPADNTALQTPASVTISATASDSDGSVAKVEFFRNGVLLGSDTTSPYSYAWANIPIGTYVLTAKATDNLGATKLSLARTLTVKANQPPVVALTLPANGTSSIAGVPISIAASASDPDGTIAKVEFFTNNVTYGSSLIGTDTSSPYGISYTLSTGVNTLKAVATDNKGAQTTSTTLDVTVVDNQPPSVAWISPINGQAFPATAPPDITLSATASDLDGTIASVKFYYLPSVTNLNPEPVRILVGAVTSPPYQLIWRGVPLTGTGICDTDTCSPEWYEVIVEATDDAGGVWADSAYISVPNYSPWTIQITAPVDRLPVKFNAPATVVLNATTSTQSAGSDPVVKVEFVADGSVIGTVTGAPNGAEGEYMHVWRNLGAGTRVILARLYDAAGFVVDSTPVTIRIRDVTQPPVVSIASPANGLALFPSATGGFPGVTVTAVAADVDGTIAQLEIVTDDAMRFTGFGTTLTERWNDMSEGVHVITARATDNGFARSTSPPVYVQVVPWPRLQAVVLTSPMPGAVTNPLVLAAEVGAPENGVEKVQFFDGPTLLGTVTAPPYRLQVSAGNGTHTYMAVAKMYNHFGITSTPVTVTVSGSNVLPSVSLTGPVSGQTFSLGSTVPLTANASDPDGTIAKVEFSANSTTVATATAAPYAGAWTPAAAGSYTLRAKATDNQLGIGLSAIVNVTITTNTPPQVSILAPVAGQTYFAGVPFALTANATDPGGAVVKVEFFAGATLIGTANSSPFTISWSAPTAGTYVLTARATDNASATTTSAGVGVTVAANAIPAIALTMPRTGQSFATGDTISIAATANDADGAISRVEFFAGAVLLSTINTAPYIYIWTGAATGNYVLTARVVDGRGATIVSAPVTISVKPLVFAVTSPPPNASVPGDFALITGTYTAPANSGITVNGTVAATDGKGQFLINNFPLERGTNAIEIALTTLAGQTVSQTIAITSTGDSPFQIVAHPGEGMAPLQVALRYSARMGSVASFRVDNLGSGTLDTSKFGPGMLGVMNFTIPGIYQPQVTIYYEGGMSYTQSLAVVVQDAQAVDQGFLSMLADFTGALRVGNKQQALQYLSGPMQARFSPAIDVLRPTMPQILDTFKGFGAITIDEDIATYAVKRQSGGKTRIFVLDFLRDFDGVWRIDSM